MNVTKLEKQKCEHCEKEYQPLRKTSRFCSSSCRAQAWKERKAAQRLNEQQALPAAVQFA